MEKIFVSDGYGAEDEYDDGAMTRKEMAQDYVDDGEYGQGPVSIDTYRKIDVNEVIKEYVTLPDRIIIEYDDDRIESIPRSYLDDITWSGRYEGFQILADTDWLENWDEDGYIDANGLEDDDISLIRDSLGLDREVIYDVKSYTIDVPPDEPECSEGNHKWVSPHEVVGGLDSNPGVYGSNHGGVRITEVCRHCGVYRITDTGATSHEGKRYTSVTYKPSDEVSESWLETLED